MHPTHFLVLPGTELNYIPGLSCSWMGPHNQVLASRIRMEVMVPLLGLVHANPPGFPSSSLPPLPSDSKGFREGGAMRQKEPRSCRDFVKNGSLLARLHLNLSHTDEKVKKYLGVLTEMNWNMKKYLMRSSKNTCSLTVIVRLSRIRECLFTSYIRNTMLY